MGQVKEIKINKPKNKASDKQNSEAVNIQKLQEEIRIARSQGNEARAVELAHILKQYTIND